MRGAEQLYAIMQNSVQQIPELGVKTVSAYQSAYQSVRPAEDVSARSRTGRASDYRLASTPTVDGMEAVKAQLHAVCVPFQVSIEHLNMTRFARPHIGRRR